jgi:hypothetical protein
LAGITIALIILVRETGCAAAGLSLEPANAGRDVKVAMAANRAQGPQCLSAACEARKLLKRLPGCKTCLSSWRGGDAE